MNKEFIPYEEAVALKELGFDEPCMAWHDTLTPDVLINTSHYHSGKWNYLKNAVSLPLYQQAFRWFREKYKLYPEIGLHDREDEETWRITISILGYYELAYNQNVSKEPYHKTCEEAELACLKKLIEIVKEKA